jgi:hypothetical protein
MTNDSSGAAPSSKPVTFWSFPEAAYEKYAHTANEMGENAKDSFESTYVAQSARIMDETPKLLEFDKLFSITPKGVIQFENLPKSTRLYAKSLRRNQMLFGSLHNIDGLIDIARAVVQDKKSRLNKSESNKLTDLDDEDLEKICKALVQIKTDISNVNVIIAKMGSLQQG